MNDYLLYMVHNGLIIDEEEYQSHAHESWTVLFHQLCKLYIESSINEKLMEKLNLSQKL
jgi:hypothetical protein